MLTLNINMIQKYLVQILQIFIQSRHPHLLNHTVYLKLRKLFIAKKSRIKQSWVYFHSDLQSIFHSDEGVSWGLKKLLLIKGGLRNDISFGKVMDWLRPLISGAALAVWPSRELMMLSSFDRCLCCTIYAKKEKTIFEVFEASCFLKYLWKK
jgi:hypothetical protein